MLVAANVFYITQHSVLADGSTDVSSHSLKLFEGETRTPVIADKSRVRWRSQLGVKQF